MMKLDTHPNHTNPHDAASARAKRAASNESRAIQNALAARYAAAHTPAGIDRNIALAKAYKADRAARRATVIASHYATQERIDAECYGG